MKNKETVKQVGKFGVVGIMNTVIDFGVYNLLIFAFSFYAVYASIISVSIAIINSYIIQCRSEINIFCIK